LTLESEGLIELDTIIRQCLVSFEKDLANGDWVGRENEAVNLFAFGYLLKCVKNNSILYDFSQVGIEVSVQQVEKENGGKSNVRKDLVIWSKAKMTRWNKEKKPVNQPLVIMEWKLKGFSKSIDARIAKNKELEKDSNWLKKFSKNEPNFVGYSVLVDIKSHKLEVIKIHNGNAEAC